jgi:hypothetical protein
MTNAGMTEIARRLLHSGYLNPGIGYCGGKTFA